MLKKHWVLLLNIVILTFLLAKNPFSERTLIPNFEPYPDAIHYIVPARSFVQGGDFTINREGRSIKPTVPPLYSTFLIPFFMINSDPRFFYVANIFLSLGSLVLLYMVLRKYTQSWFFLFVSLFLYSTNYFIYWYPSLAMAENLTLFLFLLNLYIITLPINRVTAALAGIIPFCFFITKYANIPLTITFLFAFGIKLVLDKYIDIKQLKEKKFKTPVLFFGWSIFCTLLILIYTESLPGFAAIGGLFGNLLPHTPSKIGVSSGNGWFSFSYIRTHLPLYVRALFGSFSVKFLWDTTPLLPIFVATPGVIGLFIASRSKKTGLFALTILCALISSVIFMSAFYSFDMRYLYFSIPTLIIGFVLFWDTALAFQLKTKYIPIKKYSHYVLYALLSFLFLFYCATSAVRLKKQVMLNLKYAETPWYYLSVIKLNEYFKNYPKNKKAPVVISAMIPYYIDFYSNGEYSLLPMSDSQEFRDHKVAAWGDFDYSDLMMLYSKVLYSGHEVYIHNYGIGNEKPLQDDFQKIKDNFYLTKVASGCFDACNIWQLKIKYPLRRKEDVTE